MMKVVVVASLPLLLLLLLLCSNSFEDAVTSVVVVDAMVVTKPTSTRRRTATTVLTATVPTSTEERSKTVSSTLTSTESTSTSTDSTSTSTESTSSSASSDDDALFQLLIDQQQGKKGHNNSFPHHENKNRATSPATTIAPTATTTTATTTTKSTAAAATATRITSPLLDEYRDYEMLRPTQFENEFLEPFFFQSGLERKLVIVNRFIQVYTTLTKAKQDWTLSQAQRQAVTGSVSVKEEEVSPIARSTDKPDAAEIQLCEAVASLGPLAVKLGQTLSQRPDIVGKPACDALKRLQTQNTPFPNEQAFACIREALQYWDGPLATNMNILGEEEQYEYSTASTTTTTNGTASIKPALFKYLSPEPIASASLGQVYKATTHDGMSIAVKVQRPNALSLIAIDSQCFRVGNRIRNAYIKWGEKSNTVLNTLFATNLRMMSDKKKKKKDTGASAGGMTEEEVRSSQGSEGTVASVIDRVARDIKREMDYNVEAANSYQFRNSLKFLGFVDTPDVILSTETLLLTKFITNGAHLSAINNTAQELAMTRMAVEACTASMVLTGFVHADPHEGNLMYDRETGKIVFLDFGLMSDIKEEVMEGFARGISSLLSEDFQAMTESFQDIDFVTTPVMHRQSVEELWTVDAQYQLPQLATELETNMKATSGGLSRFGALTTVLNKKISPTWLVFTPPYVLLLIRTFLTLEGIAAQVDPDFNIYQMSLPWVVRRSLSPSTTKGIQTLRNTILTSKNQIQWERFVELASSLSESSASSSSPPPSPQSDTTSTPTSSTAAVESPTSDSTNTIAGDDTPQQKKQQEYDSARNDAMKDAVGTLLGSLEGKALRSVLKDIDTPDLLWKLSSKQGRPIVKMTTEKVIEKWRSTRSSSKTGTSFFSKLLSFKRKIQQKELSSLSSSSLLQSKDNEEYHKQVMMITTADSDDNKIQTTEVETTAAAPITIEGGREVEQEETEIKNSVTIENYRPISEECKQLRKRQIQRTKLVTNILIRRQLKSCLLSVKGLLGMTRLSLSILQIMTSIFVHKMIHKIKLMTTIPTTTKSSPLFGTT